MIFRRSTRPETPPELQRLASARRAIAQHELGPQVEFVFDDVARSLAAALADRQRLASAIEGFDVGAISAELKQALRSRPSLTSPDTPTIVALRRRHETVNALRNRDEDLGEQIERTLVDVETLVAQSIAASFGSTSMATDIESHIQQLIDDASALERAHQELARIS